ncbi:ataxin 1 isoform X2 [Rhodnius prolixus]
MISSGGAVVEGTRASHVAPALSFPPHHPLYPPTVPEFLRPPLPPRYRHPGNGTTTSVATTHQSPVVPVSAVTSPLAAVASRSLSKDDEDYPSYRLYSYPYHYAPYLYPIVRPLDFSYTSPPHSPLVNSANSGSVTRNGKAIQIPAPSLPTIASIAASTTSAQSTNSSSSSSVRGSSASSAPASTLPPPPPPAAPPPSLAKEPLKSRLLRKRSRAGPSASFARGSLIRLASGELRRVEEMRTEDFITSAESCPALRLDPSTVVRIDSPPDSPTAVLTLSYGQHRSQTEVECAAEHPYFVYGQGWASCRPDRTLASYGLKVHQLQVGDVCISLTPRVGAPASAGASLVAAHSGGAPLFDKKRRWSAPDEIHELPPPAHQQPPKD